MAGGRGAAQIGEVGDGLRVAAVSPDGKLCVGLRFEKNWTCAVWEVASGKTKLAWQALPDGPATYNPFAWSPDSSTLAIGSGEQVILWEKDFTRSRKLKADWMVRDVRFSGSTLMARTDKSAWLWALPKGKLLYRQSQESLLAARLSPDGKFLAMASLQEPILIFDVADKKLLCTLPAGPVTVNLEFCKDSQWLASAFRYRDSRANDHALVYDWRAGKPLTARLAQPNIMGFAVTPDGSRLLTRGPEQTRVFDPAGNRLVLERVNGSRVMDSLSPDGRLVGSVPMEGQEAVFWRSDDGQEAFRLKASGVPTATSFPVAGLVSVTGGKLALYQLP